MTQFLARIAQAFGDAHNAQLEGFTQLLLFGLAADLARAQAAQQLNLDVVERVHIGLGPEGERKREYE